MISCDWKRTYHISTITRRQPSSFWAGAIIKCGGTTKLGSSVAAVFSVGACEEYRLVCHKGSLCGVGDDKRERGFGVVVHLAARDPTSPIAEWKDNLDWEMRLESSTISSSGSIKCPFVPGAVGVIFVCSLG